MLDIGKLDDLLAGGVGASFRAEVAVRRIEMGLAALLGAVGNVLQVA